jgi:uncharacterized membrane protein
MTLKNKITNIVAFVVFFGTAVNETLSTMAGNEIDWLRLLSGVAVAVIGYFTGRDNK